MLTTLAWLALFSTGVTFFIVMAMIVLTRFLEIRLCWSDRAVFLAEMVALPVLSILGGITLAWLMGIPLP